MHLLCRYIILTTDLVALIVVDIFLLDRVRSQRQTVFSTTDMSFQGKARRFRFDLVNARPSA